MSSPGAKVYDQVLLFGDSITEWSSNVAVGFDFQPSLQQFYSRRLDVINRGFSGYNTAHALLALPQIMPRPEQARVRLLYIFFGANDSAMPDYPSKQHVPLEKYKENLKAIITHPTVQAQNPKILLVVPAPIDEAHLEESGFGEGGRLAAVTALYAEGCRQVAREMDVACADLWTAFMQRATNGAEIPDPLPGDKNGPRNDGLRELLIDGLHFTQAGYKLMFETVTKEILGRFPDLDPGKMEPVLPLWTEAPKAEGRY